MLTNSFSKELVPWCIIFHFEVQGINHYFFNSLFYFQMLFLGFMLLWCFIVQKEVMIMVLSNLSFPMLSVEQLNDIGCKWVILGHSERRHVIGEDDQVNNPN